MSAFDLMSSEADARVREMMRQPEPAPGAFSNFWGAAGNAALAAPMETARALSPVLDTFGKAIAYRDAPTAAMINNEPAPDPEQIKRETINRIGENDLRQDITPAINRLTPDPRVTGTASQLMFGFTKSAGKAVGYSLAGGPIGGAMVFGLDEGINETMRLEDKGVDTKTAIKGGAAHGIASAVSAALPIAGKTKLQTATIVAAGGPASYVGENLAIREILRSAQFDRIAEDYKPFDPMGLIVSTAAPAVFGAGSHIARSMRGEPRGIRNNNPGNLVRSEIPWAGKALSSDTKFEAFTTPEQGIAAMARNLLTYQAKHGLDTIESIISRWAPPKENKTGQYVADVAKEMGVKPGDKLNIEDPATLAQLTQAIIRRENGKQPYTEAQIKDSVQAAVEGRAIRPTAEQVDAARVANLADYADRQHLGANDFESANANISAMETAARLLDEGLPVRVADMIRPNDDSLQALRDIHDAGASEYWKQAEDPAPMVESARPSSPLLDPQVHDTFRANMETAATPEQRSAYQALLDDPGKIIPSGEYDTQGQSIARPAAELLAAADTTRMNADVEARGITAAVTCFLRG